MTTQNQTNTNGSQNAPKHLSPAERRRQLVIDLRAAEGRLKGAEERAKNLESTQPTAYVEIRKAKHIASAAKAIVQLYANELKEFDGSAKGGA